MIVGVLATLVSLYYYLGDRAGDVHAPPEELQLRRGVARRLAAARPAARTSRSAIALVVSVGSLFAVPPLIDLARDAASALPL